MAVVAKMQASEVNAHAGQRYEACEKGDEGAMPAGEAQGLASYYGVPPWLRDAEFVRLTTNSQGSESIKLTAVSAKDEDDPNRDWASATPSGHLEMQINNPEVFGYFKAGRQYRVTIEEIVPARARPKLTQKGLPH